MAKKSVVSVLIAVLILVPFSFAQFDASQGWHPFEQLSADTLATTPLTDFIQLDPSINREVNVTGDFYVLGNDLYGKDSLRFRTEGSPWAMIIENTGDVGIGINPFSGVRLHVNDDYTWFTSDTAASQLWFATSYSTTPNWAGIGMDTDGSLRLTGAGNLQTDPHMAITDNGLVAVGRTNPLYHFEVYDAAMDMTSTYYGIYNYHEKDTGDSDQNDHFYGIQSDARMNDADETIGHLRGANINARLIQGNAGAAGSGADIIGVKTQAELQASAGIVDDNIYGLHSTSLLSGGTVNDHVFGGYFVSNLDGGTAGNAASDIVHGLYVFADIESASTVNGDVIGLYVNVDDDSNGNAGSAGTTYSLYVDNQDNTDYGIYQERAGILNWFGSPITAADFSCSDCINAGDLAADSVEASEIAADAVGASEIATNAVGSLEIVANAVANSEMADNAIGNAEMANDAIGSAEVIDDSLTAADLAAGSVGSSEVADNSLTADDLAAGSVGTSEVASNSLTAADLAADSVGASEIAAGAVGSSEVASNSLTAGDLASNSVGNAELTDTITLVDLRVVQAGTMSDTPGTAVHIGASTGNNYALRIKNDGNAANRDGVKITAGLDGGGSGVTQMIDFAAGDGGVVGSITRNAGTVSYGQFTANHDVFIEETHDLRRGMLMCVDSIIPPNVKDLEYWVSPCEQPYANNVLGAYAAPYGDDDPRHQVYVLGDGPILVNNQGGNIQVGDLIATSSQEGIGQKATQAGMTIGISQQDYEFTNDEEVATIYVQYGLDYYVPQDEYQQLKELVCLDHPEHELCN